MSDTERILKRIDKMLDRIEPLFPVIPDTVNHFEGGAFIWQRVAQRGIIEAIPDISPIHLDDLQCIDQQKKLINDNTRQFLKGFPANHVLLWGPKGTGKSSLIKALINEYQQQGLNLIEVDRQELISLNDIINTLRDKSARFILYCDDLSFEADDPGYKTVKVALDGSLRAVPENMLIYATSNRRHLLPEHMQDNVSSEMVKDDLHLGDTIEEKISLSERFGIWLSFHPFNQKQYLSIVDYWLAHYSMNADENKEIHKAACKWALGRGSRSGRTAMQFVRYRAGQQQLQQGNHG